MSFLLNCCPHSSLWYVSNVQLVLNINMNHSKCKGLRFCALTIQQILVNFIVRTLHFFWLTWTSQKLTFGRRWKTKTKRLTQFFYKNWILPKYETIAYRITDQKANLEKNSRKLKSDVDKHGNQWNKAIDTIIHKYK